MPGEFYEKGKTEKLDIKGILSWLDNGTFGLVALKALLELIKAQTDKLAGAVPVVGSKTANWQSGTGTSGEAGADLVTICANNTKNKVLSFLINIVNITAASIITVRMYQQINGTEAKVYSQNFLAGTDPNGLWIIQAAVGIHEALRVELYSNVAGDNGKEIHYDFMLEVM